MVTHFSDRIVAFVLAFPKCLMLHQVMICFRSRSKARRKRKSWIRQREPTLTLPQPNMEALSNPKWKTWFHLQWPIEGASMLIRASAGIAPCSRAFPAGICAVPAQIAAPRRQRRGAMDRGRERNAGREAFMTCSPQGSRRVFFFFFPIFLMREPGSWPQTPAAKGGRLPAVSGSNGQLLAG